MFFTQGRGFVLGTSLTCQRRNFSPMPSLMLQNRHLSNLACRSTPWTVISGFLALTMTRLDVLPSHSLRDNAPLSSPSMVFTYSRGFGNVASFW